MRLTRTLPRSLAATGALLTLGLGLSACGNDDSNASASAPMTSSSAGDQTFGAGCAAVPADGAGSFNGMATAPVASAASANPLLTTLVTAVTKAGLVDTLNSAEGLTVFAPTDDAFAKIPAKTLDAVLADKKTLTAILTHHVIAGQLSPDELAGEHTTLAGDKIMVSGSGESFTVGKENANVICGNIPTANATVYVVDTVLLP